jgi:polyhydroxybutyrate depolymerase
LLKWFAVRARGFILVVPEGTRNQAGHLFWNASRACCAGEARGPDDLGYLRRVLAEVARHYAIDRERVLAFGVSNGGFMAYRWACEPGAELTAFASLSGAGPGSFDPPCRPSSAISVLQVHGDEDDVIRYEGGSMHGADYPSARRSLDPFLRAARLAAPAPTQRSDTLLFGAIEKQAWTNEHARVALWTVRGGQHRLRAVKTSVPTILDFLAPPRP